MAYAESETVGGFRGTSAALETLLGSNHSAGRVCYAARVLSLLFYLARGRRQYWAALAVTALVRDSARVRMTARAAAVLGRGTQPAPSAFAQQAETVPAPARLFLR